MLSDVLRDARLAVRTLRRSPGFALVAILTLGAGLGVNAAIFGVVDAALLRPLSYPESDRLVTVHILANEGPGHPADLFPWSYPKFDLFRSSATAFDDVAGYGTANLNLIAPEGPQRLEAELVSASYFQVLGLRAAAGRLLIPGEDARAGAPDVVVLGHALWQARFGGDSSLIGTTVRLDNHPLTVVGVAPPGFRGLSGGAEVFLPISLASVFEYERILAEEGNHWFLAVARLRPGSSLAAADADARRAGAIVDRRYRMPEQKGAWTALARPLAESRADPGFRRSVLLLAGAVGVVLLIACVNLTSLLMVRAVSRRREIAVRLALGAARGRVIRQVLTEALVLSLAGWIIALGVARLGVRLLVLLGPGGGGGGPGVAYLFDPATVRVDGRVALFALALSLAAALVVGLVPAMQASRPGVTDDLKSGGGSGARGRAHQVLVAAEVALALMLLVGAGLLSRSFARLHALDVGFDPSHVLTLRYSAADGDLAQRDAPAFREAVVTRLAALPGVDAASVGLCAPLESRCGVSVVNRVDAQTFAIGSGTVRIGLHPATPDHFRVLGIPLVAGRAFTPEDRAGAPRVIILNETAARRLFRAQDPIGHRVAAASGFFAGGDSTALVVGIAKDVRYGAMDDPAMADVYYPAYQTTFGGFGTVFVRTRGEPLSARAAVEREIHAIDPNLPLYSVLTMEERAGAALARQRFAATLFGIFATMALILAALGLYGVMAFTVAQRTREIGLRMALGADASRVLRGVVRQGLSLAGIGIAIGLGGALALQRVMTGMLYEVTPTDPVTLVGVSVLMTLATLVSALLPARRATRVDPMDALRAE